MAVKKTKVALRLEGEVFAKLADQFRELIALLPEDQRPKLIPSMPATQGELIQGILDQNNKQVLDMARLNTATHYILAHPENAGLRAAFAEVVEHELGIKQKKKAPVRSARQIDLEHAMKALPSNSKIKSTPTSDDDFRALILELAKNNSFKAITSNETLRSFIFAERKSSLGRPSKFIHSYDASYSNWRQRQSIDAEYKV